MNKTENYRGSIITLDKGKSANGRNKRWKIIFPDKSTCICDTKAECRSLIDKRCTEAA